ncbi:MAG TPA: LemA family protein [Chthoniobacteraceae bacterium]|nr:LemA family protein [Chthoniobacteraceae bacterium]
MGTNLLFQRIAAVCVFIVLVCFVSVVGTAVLSYGGLVNSSQAVDAQWVSVQAAYKTRVDLVPEFGDAAANLDRQDVKSAASALALLDFFTGLDPNEAPTEQDLLDRVQDAQARFSPALAKLLSEGENSPDPATKARFHDLQKRFDDAGKQIEIEQRRYNEAAAAFNQKIARFPISLIAPTMSFYPKARFHDKVLE